jgi:hypothetical protein
MISLVGRPPRAMVETLACWRMNSEKIVQVLAQYPSYTTTMFSALKG